MNSTKADDVSIQALWPASAASVTAVSALPMRSSSVGGGAGAVGAGSAAVVAGVGAAAPSVLGSCPRLVTAAISEHIKPTAARTPRHRCAENNLMDSPPVLRS